MRMRRNLRKILIGIRSQNLKVFGLFLKKFMKNYQISIFACNYRETSNSSKISSHFFLLFLQKISK